MSLGHVPSQWLSLTMHTFECPMQTPAAACIVTYAFTSNPYSLGAALPHWRREKVETSSLFSRLSMAPCPTHSRHGLSQRPQRSSPIRSLKVPWECPAMAWLLFHLITSSTIFIHLLTLQNFWKWVAVAGMQDRASDIIAFCWYSLELQNRTVYVSVLPPFLFLKGRTCHFLVWLRPLLRSETHSDCRRQRIQHMKAVPLMVMYVSLAPILMHGIAWHLVLDPPGNGQILHQWSPLTSARWRSWANNTRGFALIQLLRGTQGVVQVLFNGLFNINPHLKPFVLLYFGFTQFVPRSLAMRAFQILTSTPMISGVSSFGMRQSQTCA